VASRRCLIDLRFDALWGTPVLQFACPYCNGMFQVDPSMAGGEAMCPMCHGLVAVPVDAFGPPVGGEPAVESIEDYDFRRSKSRGMFEGLDGGGKPSRRFEGLNDEWASDAGQASGELLPMACPHCGSGFQVDGAMAGQQAMCPTCHGVVMIPDEYGAAAGFAPPAPSFPPGFPSAEPASFGPLPPQPGYAPPGFTLPPSAPPPSFPPSPLPPSPLPTTGQPAAPATMNPLPPGFATTPTSQAPASIPTVPIPTVPVSASAPAAPLTPKSTQSSGVPLSALQPAADQPATKSAPQPTHPADAPSKSTAAASRPVPLSPTPSAGIPSSLKPTAADAPATPMSRAAKIDALLPEQADPDEEVMAERPIAIEEPPEPGFPPLFVDPDARTPLTDAHGLPMRRPSADERARNYRIRTMLLFGLGMLLLILAAVVLPQLGIVINVGETPK
jgi:hypothetical protein